MVSESSPGLGVFFADNFTHFIQGSSVDLAGLLDTKKDKMSNNNFFCSTYKFALWREGWKDYCV